MNKNLRWINVKQNNHLFRFVFPIWKRTKTIIFLNEGQKESQIPESIEKISLLKWNSMLFMMSAGDFGVMADIMAFFPEQPQRSSVSSWAIQGSNLQQPPGKAHRKMAKPTVFKSWLNWRGEIKACVDNQRHSWLIQHGKTCCLWED